MPKLVSSPLADAALLHSVALAPEAAASFPDRSVLIAASLGPHGAALHNGAEYHGNCTCTFNDLVEFHRQRIDVLAAAPPAQTPDLFAFETLRCLAEAEAIRQALARIQNSLFGSPSPVQIVSAWPTRIARQCAKAVAAFPQTIAVGVNCTHPTLIPALIAELHAASDKLIVVC